jgi:CheY-like chemotaxis protein
MTGKSVFSITEDPEWSAILQEYFEETAVRYENFTTEKNLLKAPKENFFLGLLQCSLVSKPEVYESLMLLKLGRGDSPGFIFQGRLDKTLNPAEFSQTIVSCFPGAHGVFSLLLVDDDRDFCREMKNYWESQKDPVTRVKTALNGLEAFEALKAFHPDCVIMDLKMPVLGGVEFYGQFRKKDRSTPVMVLTAITESEEIFALKKQGNPVCVEKTSEESLPDRLWGRALKMKVFGSRDLR